jgi:hypothetical protein
MLPVFETTKLGYDGCHTFSGADRAEWDQLFENLTVEKAYETLPKMHPLPQAPEAITQARLFTIPLNCQHPEAQLPPPVEHSIDDVELHKLMQAYKQLRVGKKTLASGNKGSSASGSIKTAIGQVENVVGARRDPQTGHVEVAVVWVSDNPSSGGTWEPISCLNLTSPEDLTKINQCQPDQGPSDDDYEGHAQWNEHFGPDIAADSRLIVVWNQSGRKKQKTRQAFQGLIGSGYDEPMHQILTPKQPEDTALGTRKSEADEFYMNLSNLETDYSNSRVDSAGDMASTYLEAWVLLEYWQHPFIQEHLYPEPEKKKQKPHQKAAKQPKKKKQKPHQVQSKPTTDQEPEGLVSLSLSCDHIDSVPVQAPPKQKKQRKVNEATSTRQKLKENLNAVCMTSDF